MELIVLSEKDKALFKEEIIDMMRVSDKEFVPPLSARNSTLQKNLSNAVSTADGIDKYYAEMKKQQILGAFDDGKLVGFVSFRIDYFNEVISKEKSPNVYISTLILKPETRGKGVTREMYDFLFNKTYSKHNIFTRTWSTNVAHTKILKKFGFVEFYRISNDRGNGVDTVYYSLLRSSALNEMQ